MSVLRAAGVSVVRGGRTILDRVDLAVGAGERVAVVGPSGAGKSTLLAALAGLERLDAGTVHCGPELRLGLVLQGYGLVSLLTAAENVELALQARRVPRARVLAEAARCLAAVGLAGRADHLVEELSGGEQQRVAVARALSVAPDILLADEPTAELDAASRSVVLDLLLDPVPLDSMPVDSVPVNSVLLDSMLVNSVANRTLVVATHDPEVAERCDRTVHLHGGRITLLSPRTMGR